MKQFSVNHEGVNLMVEFDQGALFCCRPRLIVSDEVANEKRVVLLDGAKTIRFVKGR